MIATSETPAGTQLPPERHRFTPANASAMAQRAQEARRARKAANEAGELAASQMPVQMTPLAAEGVKYRVARARLHFETASQRLQMALSDAGTPAKDIHALSQSVALLGEMWRKSAGVPDPGVLKPTVDRRSRRPVSLPEPT